LSNRHCAGCIETTLGSESKKLKANVLKATLDLHKRHACAMTQECPRKDLMSLLVCDHLWKAYRMGDEPVQALRGASLKVEAPGFYAIMGASGSGKSTLMHLLSALDKPDQGTILVQGQPVHNFSPQEATMYRRNRIGIVFQQFNLVATLTAQENVELPGLFGSPDAATRKSVSERATELLRRLGVDKRASHRPDALSGGEQQRVAIARALLNKPPLLLADEPTGNLDSNSSAKLWQLLAEIAQENGMMVLMVTHEPAAAAYCKQTFVLKDGVVVATLATEGLDARGVAALYQQSLGAA
jgi:putative ABC transport system ATP-binding protein